MKTSEHLSLETQQEMRADCQLLSSQGRRRFCLKNHQHLTETNQKTRVLSQKNQKIYTGAEPPCLYVIITE